MRVIADRLRGARRADVWFFVAVAVVYIGVTAFVASRIGHNPDRMMVLAQQLVHGRLDSPTFANTVDSVALGGRYYVAVGPLQTLPYLAFVPIHALHGIARYLVSLAVGLAAAWLALPLARAYGGRGPASYWVATFIAFGTLLFFVAVFGNFYYLAHAESFLALELFLIEWAGRRRSLPLGVCLAISFLARPTTIVAAIPFGLALLWQHRFSIRTAVTLAAPLAIALALEAAYNIARFGAPLETGYGISLLLEPTLIARRADGLFGLGQAPENLRLALLNLPNLLPSFPFIRPDDHGMSMLLVSPGLLVAVRAGVRAPLQRTLWIAALLVAIPVFLYYGDGYTQYGFRYSLDFTPFLLALVALGAAQRFGRLEKMLFAASIASVSFGILSHARVV